MADLFFPQLSSGAIAQYPIRKTKLVRTVKNIFPDGIMILNADPEAYRLVWELRYSELSEADLNALQAHFVNCAGPLRAFTFIDPTENMLSWSSDLTAPVWLNSLGLAVGAGVNDPSGGVQAFQLTNNGQTNEELSQTVGTPANYQYCFSLYVRSDVPTGITLSRRGATDSSSGSYAVGSAWSRIVSTGRLNDTGTSFSIAVGIPAGQQVQVYGVQLEAQVLPSRYRSTTVKGGVYTNAHWAVNQLPVIAEAPNMFSTAFSIEAAV